MKEQINTEIANGYKMTELGHLPQEWEVVRLGEVAVIIRNGVTIEQEKDKIGYKITRIETISNFFIDEERVGYSNNVNQEILNKYLIKKGDILFSHINSDTHIGKTALAKKDYKDLLHGMNLLLIRLNENVSIPDFINYLFNHLYFIGFFKKICKRAVNQSSINQANLKSIQIPLPPLPEQRKIAAILSTVQKAIETEKALIERTKELKKSMMHKLFTEGIGWLSGAETSQKQTEIGPIPENWEVVRLGEVAEFKNGINFTLEEKGDKGILTIDVLNMYSTGLYIDLHNLYRVNKNITEDYILKDGDILFVRSSLKREGVGWTSLFKEIKEPVSFCGFIIRARLKNNNILPEYLTNYLRTEKARMNLVASSGKVAITNINQGILRNIFIPLPPLPEQQVIANILSTIDQKIEHHTTKKQKLEELFRTLLHQLMTAQRRVNELDIEGLINENR